VKYIDKLEIHVAHGCNFSCESCAHYSNHRLEGIVTLEEAGRWMGRWNRRISPRTFCLVGGEPTIHPTLSEFVELSRQSWPTANLRLVTNGWFLHQHPALPKVLQKDPDACICLSIHHDAPEYGKRLQPILELLGNWVHEYGIKVFYYEAYKNWTQRYKGHGSTMEPFEDNQPRRSWEACPAKKFPQLFEGKIWKCAQLAYLKLQDAKHCLPDMWKPYLQYQPLAPDCTDDQMNEFFGREEEPSCGMCPADPQRFKPPLPLGSRDAGLSYEIADPGLQRLGVGDFQKTSDDPFSLAEIPFPTSTAEKTGINDCSLERTVSASSPAQTSPAFLSSQIHEIDLPLAEDKRRGWKPYHIFRGPTPHVKDLSCHVSVLSQSYTPHPPHKHIEEEILIMLSGEADLLIVESEPLPVVKRYRLQCGSFVYYPAYQLHSIYNPGPQSATYLMFKWRSGQADRAAGLRSSVQPWLQRIIFRPGQADVKTDIRASIRPWLRRVILRTGQTDRAKGVRASVRPWLQQIVFRAEQAAGDADVRTLLRPWLQQIVFRAEQMDSATGLRTLIIQYLTEMDPPCDAGKNGFLMRCVFEGSTCHLRKLHCHVTTLQPGAGYPPHADGYDVAILTLRGTVETLGRRVGQHNIIYYAAGEPHGMKNVGNDPAVYLVFEFHGRQP